MEKLQGSQFSVQSSLLGQQKCFGKPPVCPAAPIIDVYETRPYNGAGVGQSRLKGDLDGMWTWMTEHVADLVVAGGLALGFAVILAPIAAVVVELYGLVPRLRDRIRRYKNKKAEKSIKRLSERIAAQEAYRSVISSVSGRYLLLFRTVFAVLIIFGSSALALMLAHTTLSGILDNLVSPIKLDAFAGLFLCLGFLACYVGMQITLVDTHEKVEREVAKLDADIVGMKATLTTLIQAKHSR
jgi:hypothetical protein